LYTLSCEKFSVANIPEPGAQNNKGYKANISTRGQMLHTPNALFFLPFLHKQLAMHN